MRAKDKNKGEDNLSASKDVAEKIRRIINDKQLSQATIAEYAKTSTSQFSRMLNGRLAFSLQHIANIASELNMDIVDIFQYGEDSEGSKSKSTRRTDEKTEQMVSVSFEIPASQRDYLLNLVMRGND